MFSINNSFNKKSKNQSINFQKYYSKKYDKLSYNIFIINFVEILWARLGR